MTPKEREVMELWLETLENNKKTHYYCEDTWYSCPQHEDGCANDSVGDECNCGADKANAKIDKTITAIKAALEAHKALNREAMDSSPNGEAQPAVTESHKQSTTCGEPVAKYSDIVSDGGLDPQNTTPPQRDSSATPRTWVGLTDEERKNIMIECESTGDWAWELKAAQAIEAKLKEKNT